MNHHRLGRWKLWLIAAMLVATATLYAMNPTLLTNSLGNAGCSCDRNGCNHLRAVMQEPVWHHQPTAAVSSGQSNKPTRQPWPTSNISSGEIPRILHYVFKSHKVFEAYKPMIRSCLAANPDWLVLLWRDADSEKLVAEHYGFFAAKYKAYKDRLEKSDAVRYMILHQFGGIYLDMDVLCLRPFDELLNGSSSGPVGAFLGEERREQTRILYGYSFCTMNSLMGSRPGHPFYLSAVRQMLQMPSLNHARLSTGPDFLTKAYQRWLNCSACQAENPVTVFPARLVSPLMDTSLVNWQKLCQPFFNSNQRRQTNSDAWKAVGCGELVAKAWQFDDTDNDTVTVHKFSHLGYGANNAQGKTTFDLLSEFPRVKIAANQSGSL